VTVTPVSEDVVELSQYLTFQAAGEEYAIAILQVKEILSYTGATKIPMAPDAIRGLINLRGSAVPVVDLAVQFGRPETPASKRACVVIVDVGVGEQQEVMGILTDSVSEVIDLRAEEIEDAPSFGAGVRQEYVAGLAKAGEGFVPILDIERVLSSEDLLAVADSVRSAGQPDATHASESTRDSSTTAEAGAAVEPEAEDQRGRGPAEPSAVEVATPTDTPQASDEAPVTKARANRNSRRKKSTRG
jgi:purine-binding chemotaxis protein CheW